MSKFIYQFLNWYAVRFRFHFRPSSKRLRYLVFFLKIQGLLDKTYRTKNIDGLLFNINLRDHVQHCIFWHGIYEPLEIAVFKKLISPDSILFDIGANVGNYALTATKTIGSQGAIHCFEASISIAKGLRENKELNQAENIYIHQVAVANKPGKAKIFLSKDNNIGMTGLLPAENFSSIVEEVNVITIDDFVKENRIQNIAVLKMDIEGSELMALQGMSDVLEKLQPLLLIEICARTLQRFETTPEAIYKLLSSFHYQPYKIIDASTLKKIYNDSEEANIILFATTKHKIEDRFSVN